MKKKYLFSEAPLEFHAKNGREKGRDRNYRNMFWKLFIGEGFFELLLEI